MPKPIWTGAISFGLVTVPVKLFTAVRKKEVRFHQVDESSGSRIKYKRVSEKTGREVPYERIKKGYEVEDGEYVVLAPEELEKLTPESTRRIDITDFVDISEIDPIYYDHPYFLGPDKGGDKAYALLLKAMEDSGKIGIGRVVIRTKEYLAAIRPYEGKAIAMETMLFPDEIVDVDDVPSLPKRTRVGDKELKMAKQLIGSLADEFDPSKYHDEYRKEVLGLIKKKAKGKTIEIEHEEEERPAVADLMEALRASVEGSDKKKSTKRRTTSKRRSGARKSA